MIEHTEQRERLDTIATQYTTDPVLAHRGGDAWHQMLADYPDLLTEDYGTAIIFVEQGEEHVYGCDQAFNIPPNPWVERLSPRPWKNSERPTLSVFASGTAGDRDDWAYPFVETKADLRRLAVFFKPVEGNTSPDSALRFDDTSHAAPEGWLRLGSFCDLQIALKDSPDDPLSVLLTFQERR